MVCSVVRVVAVAGPKESQLPGVVEGEEWQKKVLQSVERTSAQVASQASQLLVQVPALVGEVVVAPAPQQAEAPPTDEKVETTPLVPSSQTRDSVPLSEQQKVVAHQH
jgi:hypothetical protein